MKEKIRNLIEQGIAAFASDTNLTLPGGFEIQVERTRTQHHGDFASNVALTLAKPWRRPPRQIAEAILPLLQDQSLIAKVEVAGPGFINFFVNTDVFFQIIPLVLETAERYGRARIGNDRSIMVEFVSANPTGPLHVGHGRGAAYGAALANLLDYAGYRVTREYYVNDAGRQMEILALSTWLRYLELCGRHPIFPGGAYQGNYIREIAKAFFAQHGRRFEKAAPGVDLSHAHDTDPEQDLDKLLAQARKTLTGEEFLEIQEFTLQAILSEIQDDLAAFGIVFDNWFSERSLSAQGLLDKALHTLDSNDYLYRHDGAVWFRSTAFGDEKDRVVVRENGQTTYFASDIAYHANKFDRGFQKVIDIWGADHHGYIKRMRGAIAALGHQPADFDVLLVQFATLFRGDEKLRMSTRSGEFVTLRELRNEVGNDAARFFYASRKSDQHLEFDLELAKSQCNENPVYYVQYAHARICSLQKQAAIKGFEIDTDAGINSLGRLVETDERDLMVSISRFPEVVLAAAQTYEPHLIGFYLRELATDFHTYYNNHQFLVEDSGLRNARMCLALATRQVIANGLGILGVSAPEEM